MRKFSSYGPVNAQQHYYVPRQALVDEARQQLVGTDPALGGHYITVWAPRQRGKSWIMREVLWQLQADDRFAVAMLSLQHLRAETDPLRAVEILSRNLCEALKQNPRAIHSIGDFEELFKRNFLTKPLILILDEFDALPEIAISYLVAIFRNLYNSQLNQSHESPENRTYLLHGLALIGVKGVLGVENSSGSPFNVQRSLTIPNLTFDEVASMFHDYQQESGQLIEAAVIERIYYEFQGQPGLTSWFGELLTEKYNEHQPTITMEDFDAAYSAAINLLPNNNIINLLSKARQEPYKSLVLELFQTHSKTEFRYDEPLTNFLYLNGVIEWESSDKSHHYVKFASPFVQKRLFNYFATELFRNVGRLHPPFEDLTPVVTATHLHLTKLLRLYERYLQANQSWLFKDAPRRSDLRLYEAIYHFNLYMYLWQFLAKRQGTVYPEFPTGNGQIDLLVRYAGQNYGIEVKSYSDETEYQAALRQSARYGRKLGLQKITLAIFVEAIDEASRQKYETPYPDPSSGVTVYPVFVITNEI